MRAALVAWIVLSFSPLFAAEFFVSPNGSPNGTGSMESPWDLVTAMNHPAAVKPGDTIWLRGGTYRPGLLRAVLKGMPNAPIIVRAYGNERAIIDGRDNPNITFFASGAYTWYWGFEVTNSDPQRTYPEHLDCYPQCRPSGFDISGPGNKAINLIVHDAGSGIGIWQNAVDAEAYGNILFFQGFQGGRRGHGHGIYIQNDTGTKRVVDNIIFSGFHSGIHAYGSSQASLKRMHFEGNVIFDNGLLADDPNGWGILVGGGTLAEDITIAGNYLYNPTWYKRSSNLNPAYGDGSKRVVLRDNYSVGWKPIEDSHLVQGLQANGNTFLGWPYVDPKENDALQHAGNGNTASPGPVGSDITSARVFIRPNRYEPDKATVVIYNWPNTASVRVDLKPFLRPGDSYEIVDVQNYFGGAIKSGQFDGSQIELPMNGPPAQPVGSVPGTQYRTGQEFGVFQVKRIGSAVPRRRNP